MTGHRIAFSPVLPLPKAMRPADRAAHAERKWRKSGSPCRLMTAGLAARCETLKEPIAPTFDQGGACNSLRVVRAWDFPFERLDRFAQLSHIHSVHANELAHLLDFGPQVLDQIDDDFIEFVDPLLDGADPLPQFGDPFLAIIIHGHCLTCFSVHDHRGPGGV
jgi:hypothetical protein